MTDQWIDGGECNKCRRRNYCKSQCKKAREREAYKLNQCISETLKKMWGIK